MYSNCLNCMNQNVKEVPESWNDLESKVMESIIFTLSESDLFKFGTSERTVAHRLGFYLQRQFSNEGWLVDCEYNRKGHFPKGIPRDELKKELQKCSNQSSEYLKLYKDIEDHVKIAISDLESKSEKERPRRVIPDIVVHKRGCDCFNILVIEMKVNETKIPCVLLDLAKLLVFTSQSEGKYPFYKYGLFIDLTNLRSPTVYLFENGKQSNCISLSQTNTPNQT